METTIEKITIIFPPGDQLTSLLLQKEAGTKIEDLITRLCSLRAIEFNIKKFYVRDDVGENVDLSKTVGESGLVFIEIVDKKAAKKAEKEAKKKEEFVNRGVPDGVKIKIGECCNLTLQEQLFPDEKKSLEEIKTKGADICKNFSDEYIVSCLFSRKFNIDNTIDFLKKSLQWRKDSGLLDIPKFEEIPKEVWGFFFHVPGARDNFGRYIRYVNPPLIQPGKEPWTIGTFTKAVTWLQYVGVFSDGIDGIRNGFHIIPDLEGYSWKNFDLELQKQNTSLMQNNFPMLIRKISVIHPPKIFYAMDKIMKTFLRAKIANRLSTVTEKSLLQDVKPNNLLKKVGGEVDYSSEKWISDIKVWNEKNQERLRVPGSK